MPLIYAFHRIAIIAAILALGHTVAFGLQFIARDGKPHAEIVIAEKPARMTRLAARELQNYIRKISGAELPVTNAPGGAPVQVYVGKSAFTDKLGLDTAGLKHGAFRMASGTNWLSLLGPDRDFMPIEPWVHERKDKDRVLQEWDKITGDKFASPYSHQYRRYSASLDYWEDDDAGTLNAVHEFLRSLGVRWYFPGEIGEVVPKLENIELPQVERTVRPDFPLRYLQWVYKSAGLPEDDLWWSLRLGGSGSLELLGLTQTCHGMKFVTTRDEMKKEHPEYYALWNGKRATDHRECGAPCLSSEGVFQEHLKYARAVFDHYHEPLISLDVCDGYSKLCGCDLCRGKDDNDYKWDGNLAGRGLLSDYIWEYVQRAARELQKSHPDRRVSCMAYGVHMLPPVKIEKLNPNLSVLINQRRSNFHDPSVWEEYITLRKAWLEKLAGGDLFIFEHYSPNEGLPDYNMRAIAADLRSLKGISKGDTVELFHHRPTDKYAWHAMAVMHLNLYVTARLWWDANQNLDALLEEYYTLFYGPARGQIKAFIEFSEKNWPGMTTQTGLIDRALELLVAARTAAGDGIYGQRVDLLVAYCKPLQQMRARLGKERVDVPQARALEQSMKGKKLDGNLDDETYWPPKLRVYRLCDLATGKTAGKKGFGNPPTTFQVFYGRDNSLYFGIRCAEPDMASLNITATKNGDTNIWAGDYVELLVETQVHSYYRIAINPDGAMVDADMGAGGGVNPDWDSSAVAAVQRGTNGWTAEMRLPWAGDDARDADPLLGIAGRKPTLKYPWFINVCRQRVRNGKVERSAWSPTGTNTFYDEMKFGELYIK